MAYCVALYTPSQGTCSYRSSSTTPILTTSLSCVMKWLWVVTQQSWGNQSLSHLWIKGLYMIRIWSKSFSFVYSTYILDWSPSPVCEETSGTKQVIYLVNKVHKNVLTYFYNYCKESQFYSLLKHLELNKSYIHSIKFTKFFNLLMSLLPGCKESQFYSLPFRQAVS